MMYISDSMLEKFVEEDLPYMDLTSHLLGIETQEGSLRYVAREDLCICGTEEVKKIFEKYDIELLTYQKSGTFVKKGAVLIEGRGRADAIHIVWKVCVNILESGSGIATRTKTFVDLAKKINPKIEVVTTRKNIPGTKALAMKAILSGGAYPHRLGLSESILVFQEHLEFIGGLDRFLERLDELKQQSCEKKIAVEAHNPEDALKLARAQIDIIQLDKFSPEMLTQTVSEIKKISTQSKVSAAGGVNLQNVEAIAASGVDILVTSALYFGKPSDIKAEIRLL
ncbi:ModD protein [Sulfurospirillum sp. 1612]|uniref:ModD protein n=1 Tax=Sulfurospirillum sp. 1612 TaxID=3094835 RepID=UPI002F94AA4A